MQRLKDPVCFATMVLGISILCGCGGGGGSTHQTEYVEGVVTLDGDPVPGATVTFVPVNDNQGVSATGTTDEEGRYTLTTVDGGVTGKPDAGTVAGEYYVGVVKTTVPPSPESEEDEGYEDYAVDEGSQPEITYVVPRKYNNPRKSDLKVTVEEGENDIPLELTAR